MASAYLSKTFGSAGNRKTFTMSCWVKRSLLSSHQRFFGWKDGGGGYGLIFEGSDKYDALRSYIVSGGSNAGFLTNRLFTDTSAWYHIVLKIDTTQSTEADRMKLYINGVEETSFSSRTYPNQNEDTSINKADICRIGANPSADNSYLDGLMTHVNFVDGTALTPTSFGQSDSNGVWIPKPSPSVTYGSNGFFLKMDNSGNMGLDSGGGSNNFTTNGTITQAKDTPSNVFATFNPLDNYWSSSTYANGNNTVTSANNGYTYSTSTLGVNTGKFYWECKWSAQPTGSSNQVLIGIAKRPVPNSTTWLGSVAYTYGYQGSDGHVKVSGGNATGSSATTYAVGDIISVALDLDNNKLHFAKNGSWTNSSDPAGNSGGVTITAPDSTSEDSGFYFAAFGDGNSSLQETGQFNFGNGYFGTTAVTSAGTNASDNGVFEYDVPTGYTALSTKGLNS